MSKPTSYWEYKNRVNGKVKTEIGKLDENEDENEDSPLIKLKQVNVKR